MKKDTLLGVRLPADLLAQIDAFIARRKAEEPGLELTRSSAIRLLLAYALRPMA